MMPSNHLILCYPLLLLPSIFPSIRVYSCELALHIRWPKYWSFSFSISPSNKYSGLIFFRIRSVAQSCPTLCDPMNRSTPGLPVHHHLPEFAQTHIIESAMDPTISFSVDHFSSCPQSFPASGSIPMNRLFASGGQIIGASASAAVLPMNIQD